MQEKTLLKIKKIGSNGRLFISIGDTPIGWKLSEDLINAILEDLKLQLNKFESEDYEENIELIESIIDEFSL